MDIAPTSSHSSKFENVESDLSGSSTSHDEFEYETSPSDVEIAENNRRKRIKRLGYRGALTVCEISSSNQASTQMEICDPDDPDHIPGEAYPRTPSPDRYNSELSHETPLRYRYAQREFYKRREATRRRRRDAYNEETNGLYRNKRAKRRRVHTTRPDLAPEERKRRSPTPDESCDSFDEIFDRNGY